MKNTHLSPSLRGQVAGQLPAVLLQATLTGRADYFGLSTTTVYVTTWLWEWSQLMSFCLDMSVCLQKRRASACLWCKLFQKWCLFIVKLHIYGKKYIPHAVDSLNLLEFFLPCSKDVGILRIYISCFKSHILQMKVKWMRSKCTQHLFFPHKARKKQSENSFLFHPHALNISPVLPRSSG